MAEWVAVKGHLGYLLLEMTGPDRVRRGHALPLTGYMTQDQVVYTGRESVFSY